MQRRSITLLTAIVLLASPCLAGASPDESANSRLVRQMIDAINHRDLDALDAVVAADMVRHSAATPGFEVRSLDDFKAFLKNDFATVPDSVIEIEHLIAQGDLVAVHAIYSGTQEGAMGPFPASGRRVEGPFLSFLRIADGRIAEMWVEWDNLAMLRQLGHLPSPEPASADVHEIVDAFQAAWNGDPDAAADIFTDDVDYLEVPTGRRSDSPAAVAAWIRQTRRWAPDFTIRSRRTIVQGDRVAYEWVMEGTQTGEWPEARTTGEAFSVPGVSILELRDGRIAAGRDYWDLHDLMRQLGLEGE
jgi:steroid delta-isomerase-like uncharacterized protein